MCEQCLTNAELIFVDVLPGFTLMQAASDGNKWKAGQFGLVESNDPTVIFDGPLLQDPSSGLSDDAINAFSTEQDEAMAQFCRASELLSYNLMVDPISAY